MSTTWFLHYVMLTGAWPAPGRPRPPDLLPQCVAMIVADRSRHNSGVRNRLLGKSPVRPSNIAPPTPVTNYCTQMLGIVQKPGNIGRRAMYIQIRMRKPWQSLLLIIEERTQWRMDCIHLVRTL